MRRCQNMENVISNFNTDHSIFTFFLSEDKMLKLYKTWTLSYLFVFFYGPFN